MHQFKLAFVLVLCLTLQSIVAAKLSFSPGNRRQAAASVGRHENVKAEGRFTSQFINQLNTLKGATSSSTCPPATTTLSYPDYTTTPTSTSTSPTSTTSPTSPTSPTSSTASPTGTSPVTTSNTSRSALGSFKNRFNDLDDEDDDDDDLFLGQNFANNNWIDSNIDDDDDDIGNGNDLASTDELNLINGRRHNDLGRAARANPSQWQLQQLRQRNRRLRQQQKRRTQTRRRQQMQRRRNRQRQSTQRRRRQQKTRNARRRRAMRRRNMKRQRKAAVRHRVANNRRLRRFMQNGSSNSRRIVRLHA